MILNMRFFKVIEEYRKKKFKCKFLVVFSIVVGFRIGVMGRRNRVEFFCLGIS